MKSMACIRLLATGIAHNVTHKYDTIGRSMDLLGALQTNKANL